MKTMIGIFQGKQAENNKYLLETLYDNGPLTAWDMTKTTTGNKISLHAIYNKRLRDLQKKGYIQKADKYWTLSFKGIIAVLIVQHKPKPWNEKWNKIFEDYVRTLHDKPKKYAITENGKEIARLTEITGNIPTTLRCFENWVTVSNRVKELMEKGFINLDVVKNKSLLSLLVAEFSDNFEERR